MNIVMEELEETLNINLLTHVCNSKYDAQRRCFPQLTGQIPTKHFFINFGCISFNLDILNFWRIILNKYIASKCIMGHNILVVNTTGATVYKNVVEDVYLEMKSIVGGNIKKEDHKMDCWADENFAVFKYGCNHFGFNCMEKRSDVIFYFGKPDDMGKESIINHTFLNQGFNDIILLSDELISSESNLYKFIYKNFSNMMDKNELCMYLNFVSNEAIFR